jgi:VWFA-related protein
VRALRPFLETRLAAGAQVMVASWNGSLQVLAPFTGDPSAIAGALEALGSAAGGRLEDAYDFEPEQRRALEALGTTVAALAGLDGRKALLYVGGGIPFVPAGDLYRLAIRWSDDPRELVSEYFASDASARFAELARHANAAGVTLYPLDAAGVRDPRSVGPQTDRLRAETENDAVRDRLMIEPLELLAEETGGVAMVATNALGRALAEAAADFDDHYALGLRPPRGLAVGADVPIEVRVRRPGATARHRRSFRPRAPSE